jgi:hypothetical protein
MKKIVKAKVLPYVPITEADIDKAIDRGRRSKRLYANASNVRYESDSISIGFSDGSRILLPVAGLPEFKGFTLQDFQQLEVGFGGKALCCEGQDLDISITGSLQQRSQEQRRQICCRPCQWQEGRPAAQGGAGRR